MKKTKENRENNQDLVLNYWSRLQFNRIQVGLPIINKHDDDDDDNDGFNTQSKTTNNNERTIIFGNHNKMIDQRKNEISRKTNVKRGSRDVAHAAISLRWSVN